MRKLKIVSLDFDSTLSDSRHRHHMIDRNNGTDWEAYSMQARNDANGPAYPIARALTDMDIPWIITSGRSECARDISWEWLHERKLYPWALYLCDERHNTMDHASWKALRLLEIQEQLSCEIVLHFDDISSVKFAAEKVGIPVTLVHDAYSSIPDKLG